MLFPYVFEKAFKTSLESSAIAASTAFGFTEKKIMAAQQSLWDDHKESLSL